MSLVSLDYGSWGALGSRHLVLLPILNCDYNESVKLGLVTFLLAFASSVQSQVVVQSFSLEMHLEAEIPGVGLDEEHFQTTEPGFYEPSRFVEVNSPQGGAYGMAWLGGDFPWFGIFQSSSYVEAPAGRMQAETRMTADLHFHQSATFALSYGLTVGDPGSVIAANVNGIPRFEFSEVGSGQWFVDLAAGDVMSVTRILNLGQTGPGSRIATNELWIEPVPEPASLNAVSAGMLGLLRRHCSRSRRAASDPSSSVR